MDLDVIYSSLVVDKMSREKWGGCGCSPAWISLLVLLWLGGYSSYKVYEWAEDKVMNMGYRLEVIESSESVEATVARVAIVCGIILFWVLLFALLWHFAGKEEEKK